MISSVPNLGTVSLKDLVSGPVEEAVDFTRLGVKRPRKVKFNSSV